MSPKKWILEVGDDAHIAPHLISVSSDEPTQEIISNTGRKDRTKTKPLYGSSKKRRFCIVDSLLTG